MILWFDHERGVDGVPKLAPPESGSPPTPRQAHDRRCYLLGITEREDVERLWREHQAEPPASALRPGGSDRGVRRAADD